MYYAWLSAHKVIQPEPWGPEWKNRWIPYIGCSMCCEEHLLFENERDAKDRLLQYLEELAEEKSNELYSLQLEIEALK